jgi:hypothetical protein
MTIRCWHVHTSADDQCATLAARRGLDADTADNDDRAGDHRASRTVSGVTTGEQQTATHPRAGIGADRVLDDDLAARHAARCARHGATNAVAGTSANVKRPAAHTCAGIVTCAPEDLYLAAGHSGSDMRTRVTIDDELSPSHRRSDPIHAPNVADDAHPARVSAVYVEDVAKRNGSPAPPDLERRDLSLGQSDESVSHDAIRVDGLFDGSQKRERHAFAHNAASSSIGTAMMSRNGN